VVGVNKGRAPTRGTGGVGGEKTGLGWGEGKNEWVHLIVKLTFVWAR